MERKPVKRVLSLLLVAAMTLGLCAVTPVTVRAAGEYITISPQPLTAYRGDMVTFTAVGYDSSSSPVTDIVSGAAWTVNSVVSASTISGTDGTANLSIGLNETATSIEVTVASVEAGYIGVSQTALVTLRPLDDTTLDVLSVSPGTLSPAFSPSNLNYSVSVANSATLFTITASKYATGANVVGHGSYALNVGTNTFPILVTAQDGNTQQTYTITVTRASAGGGSRPKPKSNPVSNPAETAETEETPAPGTEDTVIEDESAPDTYEAAVAAFLSGVDITRGENSVEVSVDSAVMEKLEQAAQTLHFKEGYAEALATGRSPAAATAAGYYRRTFNREIEAPTAYAFYDYYAAAAEQTEEGEAYIAAGGSEADAPTYASLVTMGLDTLTAERLTKILAKAAGGNSNNTGNTSEEYDWEKRDPITISIDDVMNEDKNPAANTDGGQSEPVKPVKSVVGLPLLASDGSSDPAEVEAWLEAFLQFRARLFDVSGDEDDGTITDKYVLNPKSYFLKSASNTTVDDYYTYDDQGGFDSLYLGGSQRGSNPTTDKDYYLSGQRDFTSGLEPLGDPVEGDPVEGDPAADDMLSRMNNLAAKAGNESNDDSHQKEKEEQEKKAKEELDKKAMETTFTDLGKEVEEQTQANKKEGFLTYLRAALHDISLTGKTLSAAELADLQALLNKAEAGDADYDVYDDDDDDDDDDDKKVWWNILFGQDGSSTAVKEPEPLTADARLSLWQAMQDMKAGENLLAAGLNYDKDGIFNGASTDPLKRDRGEREMYANGSLADRYKDAYKTELTHQTIAVTNNGFLMAEPYGGVLVDANATRRASSVLLQKGSLILSFEQDGKSVTANDPTAPIILFMPYELNGAKPETAVLYEKTTGKTVAHSFYESGMVIAAVAGPGHYDVKTESAAKGGTHWAEDDMSFAVSRGMIATDRESLEPDRPITRAEFITALGVLSGADVSGYKQSSFHDVSNDDPAMPYIEWAAANRIVQGVGGSRFAPDGLITREQIATMMLNYTKATNLTLPVIREDNLFADDTDISDWAAYAVMRAQWAGVIEGRPKNVFDPKGSTTCAEASAILNRFARAVVNG